MIMLDIFFAVAAMMLVAWRRHGLVMDRRWSTHEKGTKVMLQIVCSIQLLINTHNMPRLTR